MPITKDCDECGASYTRPASQIGKFCSHECGYIARRKASGDLQTRYRMTWAKGHPIAPPSGLLPEHRLVLFDSIGDGPHPCHWCGTPVEWKPGQGPRAGALVVDHVDADPKNNDPTNLVPACQACNGTRNNPSRVRDDEPHMIRKNGMKNRPLHRTCALCGTDFSTYHYGSNFCSASCRSKQAIITRGWRSTNVSG